MNSTLSAAVSRRPLTICIGNLATFDLNHCNAAIGHQQHKVCLNITGLLIGESQTGDEYVAVAHLLANRVPHQTLAVGAEKRLLGD